MSRASRAVVTVASFVAVAGAIAYFLRSQGDVGRHAFGPSSVGASEDDADEERVVVRGTVLDAESGEPLAGATVTAPDGSTAVSDALGRFEFVDLAEDLSGPLRAVSADGRSAENPLRPLRRGVLEVVLRLRKP